MIIENKTRERYYTRLPLGGGGKRERGGEEEVVAEETRPEVITRLAGSKVGYDRVLGERGDIKR